MLARIVEFYGLDVLRKMINTKADTITTVTEQIALSKLFDNIKAIQIGNEKVEMCLKALEHELYEQYREDKIAME